MNDADGREGKDNTRTKESKQISSRMMVSLYTIDALTLWTQRREHAVNKNVKVL